METNPRSTQAPSATETSPPVSYQFHLFGAFNAVCSKGKNGVQTCHAISSYLQDRAAHEQVYSKQLAKIQQSVKTEDWAKHVANTWNTFHHTIAAISLEYAEFSNMHMSSIVSGMKACTSQQESQIQRLITEGTKLRTQYLDCMNKLTKAKERYERKCAEAIETIQTIRRPPTDSSEKVDIFSKVWDNTAKGLGLGSMERQKQKIAACLDDVLSSEDVYVRAVDAVNVQHAAYERQVHDNLMAFEVTEEQRLEYIKDLLVRSEKSRSAMVSRVERLITCMREALKSIDVLDDIDDGFTKLLGLKTEGGEQVELQFDITPASITALVTKMQTMSDQGVIFTHTMLNTLVECISAEETLVGALERIHSSYSQSAESTLFSSAAPVVLAEGTTLEREWEAVLTHLQRVAYLHREFGSLLAEPVSLSLDTMKTEYIETKLRMEEQLQQLMASVTNEIVGHSKLEQKLDAKVKELATAKASLASSVQDKDAMLQRFMESPMDRERKLVLKAESLHDEVADLKAQLDVSSGALSAQFLQRRQDICQIVSMCMKNEKYRLDVKKSSLRSLVKAHEHLVLGLQNASSAVLSEVEKIKSRSDIHEFIARAQVPWQAHECIVPALHGNAMLSNELKAHEKAPPKLTRPLSSLSTRTIDENKDLAMHDKKDKAISDDAPKEDALGHSDLQKNFNLPPSEQVVTSFTCALYLNNFPHHGRLYLSQSFLCFAGWRESYVVLPIIEITHIEKKNTAIVVPNGMELTTTKQGKLFFASFLFREECVQSITQLQQIKKQTQEILTPGPSQPDMTNGPSSEAADASPTATSAPIDVSTKLDLAEELHVLSQDYDPVLDLTLPFELDVAFAQFWHPTDFLTKLLDSCGETNVDVGAWSVEGTTYAAFQRREAFQAVRTVKYTHNKKYMVGPSSIPTVQVQRFKYDRAKCFVLSVTATVSDAPYHDYFRAESRWVFSPSGSNECRLQTGVRLNWVKSTWLKKQIESATAAESKETMKYWTVKAGEASKSAPAPSTTPAHPPTAPPSPKRPPAHASPVTSQPLRESRRHYHTDVLIVLGLAIALYFAYSLHRMSSTLHEMARVQSEQQLLLEHILAKLAPTR